MSYLIPILIDGCADVQIQKLSITQYAVQTCLLLASQVQIPVSCYVRRACPPPLLTLGGSFRKMKACSLNSPGLSLPSQEGYRTGTGNSTEAARQQADPIEDARPDPSAVRHSKFPIAGRSAAERKEA